MWNSNIKIALCDDNKKSMLDYQQKISVIAEEQGVVPTFFLYTSGEQLLGADEDGKRFDLIYVDISLPGVDGMTVVSELRRQGRDCEIIFVTESVNKWHRAFEMEALQYLIKNRTDTIYLKSSFVRALNRIKRKTGERVLFTCAKQSRNILISEIEFFEIDRNMVTVHYGGDATFVFYTPLVKLQQTMEPYGFLRCHQSYLVSAAHVESIGKMQLKLKSGVVIPVSRHYRKSVLEGMEKESRGFFDRERGKQDEA